MLLSLIITTKPTVKQATSYSGPHKRKNAKAEHAGTDYQLGGLVKKEGQRSWPADGTGWRCAVLFTQHTEKSTAACTHRRAVLKHCWRRLLLTPGSISTDSHTQRSSHCLWQRSDSLGRSKRCANIHLVVPRGARYAIRLQSKPPAAAATISRGALLETTRWAKLVLPSRLSLQLSSSLQNRHPLKLQLHLRKKKEKKNFTTQSRACSQSSCVDVYLSSITPRCCQSNCLNARLPCKQVQPKELLRLAYRVRPEA